MRTRTIILIGGCAAVVLALVLPNLRPVHLGMRASCVNNLQQLQGAKGQWALEFHKGTSDVPTWDDLRAYLHGQMLSCPQRGKYALGRVGELPSCSISEHTAGYHQHP